MSTQIHEPWHIYIYIYIYITIICDKICLLLLSFFLIQNDSPHLFQADGSSETIVSNSAETYSESRAGLPHQYCCWSQSRFSLHPLPIKLSFSGKAPPPIWLQYGQNKRYHLKQKCPKCVWGDLAHGQRFSACMRVCVCMCLCVCVCRWLCWGQGYQSGMLLQSATLGQKLRISLYHPIMHLIVALKAWSFNHWQ